MVQVVDLPFTLLAYSSTREVEERRMANSRPGQHTETREIQKAGRGEDVRGEEKVWERRGEEGRLLERREGGIRSSAAREGPTIQGVICTS